jgi:hypothetical protein
MAECCKKTNRYIQWLRKVDAFGIPLTFKYNSEEKYKSISGAIISIIYYLLWLSVVIIYFIPFVRKQNFTLQYYAINSEAIDDIKVKLANSTTNFAFGLKCDGEANITDKANELFGLELRLFNKSMGKNQNNYIVQTHKCTYNDFKDINEAVFDKLNISMFNCMNENEKNISMEGIYTDETFIYYALSISAKNNTQENFNDINNHLFQNDCKLQFYYMDITVNLSNYKDPITPFVNSMFLQINPHLYVRKNIFFMNYRFESQNSVVKIIKKEKKGLYTGFSRVEDYFLYKGVNRTKQIFDHNKYARIYIRADNKLIEIKREY